MSQSASREQSDRRCIGCGYDLRHDPTGPCPECGATFAEREAMLARQGETCQQQSQFLLLGLACLVLIPIILSVVVGLLRMAFGG